MQRFLKPSGVNFPIEHGFVGTCNIYSRGNRCLKMNWEVSSPSHCFERFPIWVGNGPGFWLIEPLMGLANGRHVNAASSRPV